MLEIPYDSFILIVNLLVVHFFYNQKEILITNNERRVITHPVKVGF